MASAKLFEGQPPFPEDVPLADVATISLAKLASGNAAEVQDMFESCRKVGFFVLNLNGDALGEEMIKEIDQLFTVNKDTFDLSIEEKEKFARDPPRTYNGYKCTGASKVLTGEGDRVEFYDLGQDDLLGNEHNAKGNPHTVNNKRDLFTSYLHHCQTALDYILQGLAKQLSLPPNVFREHHRTDQISKSMIRMIRQQPSIKDDEVRVGYVPHTDLGSITFLAATTGGLQLLNEGHEPGDESGWVWTKPQPGCLIVNIGDMMVQWTGGVLRSNMHRVNHGPGEQRFSQWNSIVMFLRPANDTVIKRLEGGRIPIPGVDHHETHDNGTEGHTAAEWEVLKMGSLTGGKDPARSRGGRAPRAVPVGA